MILGIPIQAIMQGLINGLAMGWIYVLMAMGLTLIYGIMRIMQFAHGEIYMIAAYIVYYLSAVFGLPLPVAIFVGIVLTSLFGIVLERFLFRPIKSSDIGPFIMTTGLILILQCVAVVMFGVYQRHIPRLAKGTYEIMGSFIPKDRLVVVFFAIILSVILYLFLKKTKFGLAMVASAQDPEGAISLGINPDRMSSLVMAMGCALAAAGGAFAGALFDVNPSMGFPALVKGLTILVLGGMGSLPGAIIGGIIIGLIDGVVPILFGPALTSILPMLLVILLLLIRPQGLFGHEG
ncbi:branched-chain amino acid ABC transporter permease [bacterium]|nr:branched-chain amino acid ABC transporter permease [bacterium]